VNISSAAYTNEYTEKIKKAKPLALGSRRPRILLPFLCTQRNIDQGTDVAKK
jgi:hypothetical protein